MNKQRTSPIAAPHAFVPRSPILDHFSVRRKLAAAIAVCALGGAVSLSAADAPTATGSVDGRVLDVDNGSYLDNARVQVEGTHQQVFTNKFGEFRLTGVPAGTVTLDVFYTGLTARKITVEVKAGEPTHRDVNLTAQSQEGHNADDLIELSGMTIGAERETNQNSIAINEQRFAPNLKTVISTAQFGDITEGNIGEFVKFLPGITVGYTASDVRNVSIRGVGSQYTAIMLDGYRVASADSGTLKYSSTGGGTRTTELEQISINNAARAEVVKARTPDLPADALGGSLNLVSKSAFEYKNPEFTYRVLASMNSYGQTLGATPGLGSDSSSRKILPSFDFTYALPLNKRIGITVSFLDSNIFNPQYRSNPQWTPNGTLGLFTGAAAFLPTQPFLQKYTMQDGPKLTHRKAGEITADFKITPNDVVSVRLQDNKYDSSFGNRNINFDVGSAMPITYGPDFTNGALGKGKITFGSSFRHKFGLTSNIGADYTHTGSDWVFNAGINYSHASSHYTDAEDGYFSAVTYQLSNVTINYADYNGVAPQKITVLDKTGKDTVGNVFDVRNPSYVITKVEDNPVLAYDSFVTEQANFKKTFNWKLPTSIKIGGQLQYERRDILNYKVDWTPTGDLAKAGAVNEYNLSDSVYNTPPPYIPYQVTWPSAAKLYSLYETNSALFSPTTAANLQQRVLGSMLFKELITAVYLMGDTRAADDRLQFVYGVRAERTSDKGYGPLVKATSSGTQYIERGSFSEDQYTGAYPSVTATYKFTDNLLLRASYNRAVGRPDLGNLVPNVALPDSTLPGQVISVSNPTLAPEQSNNYDLSLEYYFQHVGVVSAGVFRKDFSNFWGTQTLNGTDALSVLNSLGVPNAQDYLDAGDQVSTVVNSGKARVTGFEFNYRQSLENVSRWTKGLTVFANVTAINLDGSANADFSAFVSRSANWGIAYDNQRLSAQVNFNYRGRERDAPTIVNGISYGEYFAPRMYIDANLEIRINRHFGFFINGRNLTNVPQDDQRYAQGVTPDYARLYRREKFGAAYTMGVKGTF